MQATSVFCAHLSRHFCPGFERALSQKEGV